MEKHKERLNFYKNQKLDFKKVLDIGAFEGSWTKMFKELSAMLLTSVCVCLWRVARKNHAFIQIG